MEKLNLNQSIVKIRTELQNANLKKSGKNAHAGFTYFELADFLPTLNNLFEKYDISDIVTFTSDTATLKLIKGDEINEYCMPFQIFETPLTKSGGKSMQDIQYLGALNTYYKRYLYLNAFGITDGEVIDSMNNEELKMVKEVKKKDEQELANLKEELNKIVIEKQLDKKQIAVDFNITAKTTKEEFAKIIEELKNKE